MSVTRGTVRYHVPRERSPVPAVVVGVLAVVTLVSAQLAVAGDGSGTAAAGTQVQTAAPASDVTPPQSTAPQSTAPQSTAAQSAPREDDGLPPEVEMTFDVGSDAPSGDADALLRRVVQALLDDPTTRVRVVGHAEASNDPVLEEQLSLRRAETVLALLTARGVPPARAEVLGAGATEAGRSLSGTDRRVTVEVIRS